MGLAVPLVRQIRFLHPALIIQVVMETIVKVAALLLWIYGAVLANKRYKRQKNEQWTDDIQDSY